MSKVADIFRPMGDETGGAVVVAMPGLSVRPSAIDDPASELFEAGYGAGGMLEMPAVDEVPRTEESEALHRLLVDTQRKIDDLDSLKSTIGEMVLPFRGAMRALEQERALSALLSRQLSEKTALCDSLRDDAQAAENRARAFESEAVDLRNALDEARESAYVAESARAALADEIKRRDVKIAALIRQIDQETSQRRSLNETCRSMQEQARQSESRISELQNALIEAGQACDALKQDKRSLWRAAEQARAESEASARRLAEGEGMLTAIRAELGKLESRHAAVAAERTRLADAADDLQAQHEVERQRLAGQMEALEGRAVAAERQVAEMRQRLIERTEEARGFICKAADATMARAAAERRLASLEASQGLRNRDEIDPLETRTALSEFLRALNLKSRELAAAGAAEKLAARGEAPAGSQPMKNGSAPGAAVPAGRPDATRPRRAIEDTLAAARRADARLEDDVARLRAGAPQTGGTRAAPKTVMAGSGEALSANAVSELHLPVFEATRKAAPAEKSAQPRLAPLDAPPRPSGDVLPRPGFLARKAELVAKLRRPGGEDDPSRSVA